MNDSGLRVSARGPRVLISCAEASGDLYAAALVRALRAREPQLSVAGFGGPRLAAEGASLVGTFEGMTVTGITEALSVVRRSLDLLSRIEAEARRERPDVFVAIDAPDFNFRLLPRMRALGIPIVYYISPQLWAWRPKRIKTIQQFVDKMLVIFPFEQEIYERAGVPVEFVGHPLIPLATADQPRDVFLRACGLDPSQPVVALLPGSRPSEIRHVLPTILLALPAIRAQVPGVQFLLARAPGLADALFVDAHAAGVTMIEAQSDNVLASVDMAIVASGTATVQTALHETPMVIVYRVSALTYAIGIRLVGVSTYGMANLVAGRPIVKELIQHNFTPEAVSNEAVSLLTSPERTATMRRDLRDVKSRLGGVGATERAADAILAVARTRKGRE